MTEAPKRIWAWPHFDGWITGDWSANTYHDERTVAYILASEHARILAEKDARWSKNLRENYDAFSAMRNDLNETIGDMASQESTLSIGPTMEAECVAVVSAVTRAVSDMRAEIARLTAERDAIAALTVERCVEGLVGLKSGEIILGGQRFKTVQLGEAVTAIRALSPIPPHVAAARVLLANPDAVLRLAQEYDREDAATRGEPDPHKIDFDPVEDAEFQRERVACAKVALRALADQVEKGE